MPNKPMVPTPPPLHPMNTHPAHCGGRPASRWTRATSDGKQTAKERELNHERRVTSAVSNKQQQATGRVRT